MGKENAVNEIVPSDFSPLKVAWKTLLLLQQRKALLSMQGYAFYVWQRGDRLIVAFDPSKIDTGRVNDDFAHRLSTLLRGRRVERMNSRGIFLQVGLEVPPAPKPLEVKPLDMSQQPTPLHMPVGMTAGGPLWISLIESDAMLIGGSRGGGKTGEEHAFIQALLHGRQTLVYAWDGKRGAEFGRYAGTENFHLLMNGINGLRELESVLKAREKMLTESGFPNTVMYNEKHIAQILPIALFVDEAADLPDDAKPLLESMIRLYRYAGLYPIIATNQPTVANVFAKTNLSTRIAFRVPHHNDSVTMLGYKGAEALPDVRGRGLIVWKGKFVEFQSFEVTYPMPDPAKIKSIMDEQAAAENEAPAQGDDIRKLAESIRGEWNRSMSKRAVGRLLGKAYAGAWAGKIDQIIEYLSATTTSNGPVLGLEAA